MPSYNRTSLRLPDYDYSTEGIYFITIVTQKRKCLFGSIRDCEMILNSVGLMVDQVCKEIPQYIPTVELSPYQIMPNHFHALILIKHNIIKNIFEHNSLNQIDYQLLEPNVGADLRVCPGQPQRVAPTEKLISLQNIVQRFKSLTTRRYIDGVHNNNWPSFEMRLWQRNYYEHVVRDESDYRN
ncbi:MAG: transposase, partial [Brevefilum sp.]|nr:transposase [Brevefilum sp.]